MRTDSKARDRARGVPAVVAASLGATLLAAGALYASPASALSVCVRVAAYVETMPDGSSVPMWGYRVAASCTPTQLATATSAINNKVSSPGAAIAVPADDTTLTITLVNRASADTALGETALTVPTSLVLHGHNTTMTPVFTTPAGVVCPPPAPGTTATTMAALQAFRDCRVRSFTHEAAVGGTAVYTYTNVKPGTYLYQSGTMPQIQVQMGLYGMVRKNSADAPTNTTPRNAYASPDLPFDNEIAVLLSEVDPAVHGAVASGTFSGSTIGYDPKFFRLHRFVPPGTTDTVTGVFTPCATATPGPCIKQAIEFTENPARGALPIDPGQRQLVRVVNAGIQSRALELIDGHWWLVAEDGNRFPYPREQHSAHLAAAKTADLWFTPTLGSGATAVDRRLAIFDRRLALTNNNADPSGGQMIRLALQDTGTVPAVDVATCGATGTQGSLYTCTVTTGAASPTYSLDTAPVGMTISAGGAISWTPNNAQAWKPLVGQTATNPVQVRVTDSNGRYGTASFSVAVTNVNDAPVAGNDVYDVRGGVLNASTVLANDSDPDGDSLGAVAVVATTTTGIVTMNANGTFNYTTTDLPASGFVARPFTYSVSDGTLPSVPATVTLNVHANSAPVTVDDVVSIIYGNTSPVVIDVLSNDYDVDGNLNGMTLAFSAPNRGGTAVPVVGGACPVGRTCIAYTPPPTFRGTDSIQYTVSDALGATSGPATLRLNVR